MAGVINVGGLATGLDTNSIITQLVALERRPITLLQQQITDVQATQGSFSTLGAKLAALGKAADALNTVPEVLAGTASSSDEHVLAAAAGSGASRGTLSLSVSQLAQGSIAAATTGVPASSDVIATGPGTFSFQVGGGDVRSVELTAGTTLDGLVRAINDLGAGVSASAINLGTSTSPDYRLSLVTRTTGASSTIAVVQDDTTLAVQTTQAGQNALFTVSGFSGSFERESNTVGDVLPGVTISLKAPGSAVVTVTDDSDAIVANVQALVAAFNDVASFVANESTVEQGDTQDELKVGSLAGNSTARRLLDRLHEIFSEALTGATSRYVNLASLGLATQKDGTIALDENTLRSALADDPTAAAQVLAGNGTGRGVANGLSHLVADFTGIGGALGSESSTLDDQITILQDQVDAGERRVTAFEESLRQQFNALETLVSGLQSQASFLTSSLAKL